MLRNVPIILLQSLSVQRLLFHLLYGVLLIPLDTLAYRGTFQTREIDRGLISGLVRRDATVSAGNATIGDIGNSQYVSNITIGGTTFTVILGMCFILFAVTCFCSSWSHLPIHFCEDTGR